jgi:hypothetical protein
MPYLTWGGGNLLGGAGQGRAGRGEAGQARTHTQGRAAVLHCQTSPHLCVAAIAKSRAPAQPDEPPSLIIVVANKQSLGSAGVGVHACASVARGAGACVHSRVCVRVRPHTRACTCGRLREREVCACVDLVPAPPSPHDAAHGMVEARCGVVVPGPHALLVLRAPKVVLEAVRHPHARDDGTVFADVALDLRNEHRGRERAVGRRSIHASSAPVAIRGREASRKTRRGCHVA